MTGLRDLLIAWLWPAVEPRLRRVVLGALLDRERAKRGGV